MSYNNLLKLILFFFTSFPVYAENINSKIAIKSFGTLAVTGTDTDAIGFRRDVTTGHGATTNWSIPTDSRIGFQIDAKFSQKFFATAQWTLRDRSGLFFEENLDLAFLRWNITPELTIRLGRMSSNIFMLADHRNISYAYPWIRPPHEFYGFNPIYHWDGLDVTRTLEIGGGHLTFNLFGGYSFNQLVTSTNELRDQGGAVFSGVVSYEQGNLSGRLSYSQLEISHVFPRSSNDDLLNPALNAVWPNIKSIVPFLSSGATFRFSSLGVAYDDGIWLGQAEAGYVDSGNLSYFPNLACSYLSVGRRISSLTLYTLLGISKSFQRHINVPNPLISDPNLLRYKNILDNALNNNGIDEKSVSLGLRWDFYENLAFKLQWSHFWLGRNGSQNWIEDPLRAPPDEVNVISTGIDFVF